MDICTHCATPLYEICKLDPEEKKKLVLNYNICCRAKILFWTPNHELKTKELVSVPLFKTSFEKDESSFVKNNK